MLSNGLVHVPIKPSYSGFHRTSCMPQFRTLAFVDGEYKRRWALTGNGNSKVELSLNGGPIECSPSA